MKITVQYKKNQLIKLQERKTKSNLHPLKNK